MMTKQDFIALADWIRSDGQWSIDDVFSVARFCQQQNSRFDRDRWLSYLRGECGPNGGKIPRGDGIYQRHGKMSGDKKSRQG